jgi:hypothetical protein
MQNLANDHQRSFWSAESLRGIGDYIFSFLDKEIHPKLDNWDMKQQCIDERISSCTAAASNPGLWPIGLLALKKRMRANLIEPRRMFDAQNRNQTKRVSRLHQPDAADQ